MAYTTNDIRNICLLGHGGDGKTSLAESMLYLTKGTDRLGKTSDGNTVSDYDAEEIKRGISISSTVLPVEYGGKKINVIDVPGYFDFDGEAVQAVRVAEAGIICVTAKGGADVGAEKAWKNLNKRSLPRMIYVSKVDEDHANYGAALQGLKDVFGISIVPVTVPVMEGDTCVGLYSLVTRKAYKMDKNNCVEMPVPASMEDAIAEYNDMLVETVAGVSEDLMMLYLEGEEIPQADLIEGIKTGVRSLDVVPVVCGSAFTGLGTELLLKNIVDFMPSPLEAAPEKAVDGSDNEVEVKYDPAGKPIAFVFKTLSDQFGKSTFFKVISGSVKSDMPMFNTNRDSAEKLGKLAVSKGKTKTDVSEVVCGDIGSVTKLAVTKTGDTLCGDKGSAVAVKGIEYPWACYTMAIAPKTKGQEEKVATGLARLNEEDPSFTVVNNAETKQMVISGLGDIHLAVICSKLKTRFGVEVELFPAKVAYREKIRKKVKVQGRHKKQSGGHGQFGDVWIEFEPADTDEFEFAEQVFGGAVPKNFFPAVEKGLRDCITKGVLAGYPVVGLKATLVDGSYHPVDSSEMAFKTAASLAYKAGLPQAMPVLLEPIGELKVTIPDNYMGDVIGDLNKRGGRIMGMNPGEKGQQIVEAEVPMGDMSSYAIDLRSMTQGRGSFTFQFVRYEEASAATQQKAIEEYKASQTDDE
ncbi:MAG: elongation factor G [Oscillospiraceae bacterium]|nr:elongation factor G [Oscillospiraceae bacterium]